MESNLLLLLPPSPPPPPPQLHQRQLISKTHNLPCSYHRHYLRFLSTTTTDATKRRKWDSNAETVRTNSFKFNLDDDHLDYEDEDEEDDERYSTSGRRKRRWWSNGSWEMNQKKSSRVLEDVIDSIWIFKVFKSYGWLLPIILLSWLAASGPKAFVMALALPLGLSVVSLVFEKLWGKSEGKRIRNTKRRRKPSANAASNVEMEEEEQEGSRETRKGKMGYQSWVDGDDGSVKQSGQDAPSFGGWEELYGTKSMRRPYWTTKGSRKRPKEKSKLSGRGRNDTPLLLRLLIAVFPFLSWTKML